MSSLKNLEKKFETLKSIGNLKAIKAEFEAEGTRIEELSIISYLCSKHLIPLTLKIGGPCAKRDIYEAFQVGADNILVPMVESDFALEICFEHYNSFLSIFKSFNKKPSLSINIETIKSFENIDLIIKKIINLPNSLENIVIGRSDLASSMGIEDVNSKYIFEITSQIISKCKRNNIKATIGGNLTRDSYAFIKNFNLTELKAFESRKCTFSNSNDLSEELFNKLIQGGLEFELTWLDFKKSMYTDRSKEENIRISNIINRMNNK